LEPEARGNEASFEKVGRESASSGVNERDGLSEFIEGGKGLEQKPGSGGNREWEKKTVNTPG